MGAVALLSYKGKNCEAQHERVEAGGVEGELRQKGTWNPVSKQDSHKETQQTTIQNKETCKQRRIWEYAWGVAVRSCVMHPPQPHGCRCGSRIFWRSSSEDHQAAQAVGFRIIVSQELRNHHEAKKAFMFALKMLDVRMTDKLRRYHVKTNTLIAPRVCLDWTFTLGVKKNDSELSPAEFH